MSDGVREKGSNKAFVAECVVVVVELHVESSRELCVRGTSTPVQSVKSLEGQLHVGYGLAPRAVGLAACNESSSRRPRALIMHK